MNCYSSNKCLAPRTPPAPGGSRESDGPGRTPGFRIARPDPLEPPQPVEPRFSRAGAPLQRLTQLGSGHDGSDHSPRILRSSSRRLDPLDVGDVRQEDIGEESALQTGAANLETAHVERPVRSQGMLREGMPPSVLGDDVEPDKARAELRSGDASAAPCDGGGRRSGGSKARSTSVIQSARKRSWARCSTASTSGAWS